MGGKGANIAIEHQITLGQRETALTLSDLTPLEPPVSQPTVADSII